MPISIEKALKLPKEQPPRSKVNWPTIIKQIIDSGEFYSAKEVWETLAEKKVKRFRTKTVLDRAAEAGELVRVYYENMWMYGAPFEEEE